MKITENVFDRKDRQKHASLRFDEDLNDRNCVLSANGGVTITFDEEDEFGNVIKTYIDFDPSDISRINITKL